VLKWSEAESPFHGACPRPKGAGRGLEIPLLAGGQKNICLEGKVEDLHRKAGSPKKGRKFI